MKREELEKLEEGTLIKIEGNGFFGKTKMLVRFEKKCIYDVSNKGYMFGSTLYPFEWIKLATKNDFEKALAKAKEEHLNYVRGLTVAYEKAAKARKELKK